MARQRARLRHRHLSGLASDTDRARRNPLRAGSGESAPRRAPQATHGSAGVHFFVAVFAFTAAGVADAANVQTFAPSFVGSTVSGLWLFLVSRSLNVFRSSDCIFFHAASVVL